MRHVVFKLAGHFFGLPIEHVREILKAPEVTPIPQSADYIEGVIFLRGHHAAVMDLRKRLGCAPFEKGQERYVIMVKLGKKVLGLIVDKVLNIFEIEENEIDDTRKVAPSFLDSKTILSIGLREGKEIFILSLESLLEERIAKAA